MSVLIRLSPASESESKYLIRFISALERDLYLYSMTKSKVLIMTIDNFSMKRGA
jgi:hypothetical protein